MVWAEARGEPEKGQIAVAHVVLNRVRKSGRSICTVTNRPGQFTQKSFPKAFTVNLLGKDPTGGATHFRTKDSQMWLGLNKYVRIGGHTFYGE